jgi:hypothetical protein
MAAEDSTHKGSTPSVQNTEQGRTAPGRNQMDEIATSADVRTLQAFYTIGIGAGFVSLADALYALLGLATPVHLATTVVPQPSMVGDAAVASWAIVAALFLIGFRFFWAVANVRRFAEDRAARGVKPGIINREVVFIHIPFLFLHLLVYYLLCKLAADVSSARAPLSAYRALVWAYAGFQYMNAAWLWSLIRKRKQGGLRERVWIKTNLIFSTSGLATLLISGWLGWSAETNLLVAALVYITGSIIDLALTAYHYLQSPDDPRKQLG